MKPKSEKELAKFGTIKKVSGLIITKECLGGKKFNKVKLYRMRVYEEHRLRQS